ncbi:MAG: hypothetical protein JXR03_21495 [Cyclobacteriaceae bacterium]
MVWAEWFREEFKELEIQEFLNDSNMLSSLVIKSKSSKNNQLRLSLQFDAKSNLTGVSAHNNNWDNWNSFHVVYDPEGERSIGIEQDYLFADLERIDYLFNEKNISAVTDFLKIVLQGWKESLTYYKEDEVNITFEFKNGLRLTTNIYPLEELDIPLLGKFPYRLGNWYLKTFRANQLKTREFLIEGFSEWIK